MDIFSTFAAAGKALSFIPQGLFIFKSLVLILNEND